MSRSRALRFVDSLPMLLLVLPVLLALPTSGPPAAAQDAAPLLVSQAIAGGAGAGASFDASISADGGRVAFSSAAGDLVPDDDNGVADVFLYERAEARLRRVSLDDRGDQAPLRSFAPALSADGRWLVFVSEAELTGEPAPWGGLYLLDLEADRLRLVFADGDGGRGTHFGPVLDADGSHLAFLSTADLDGRASGTGLAAAFVWRRDTGRLLRIGPVEADGRASDLALSADGRWLGLASEASNLIPADPAGRRQVYVADTASGALERVSLSTGGRPGNGNSLEPSLSGDGRLVAFTSYASNLVDLDTNGVADIFVRDRSSGRTWSVTDVTPADTVYHPADSDGPSFSADGRCLAYASGMYTLEPGAPREQIYNIYLHRLAERETRRLSRRFDGARPERDSRGPALAGAGGFVAFESEDGLVAGDANGRSDVYLVAAGCDDEVPEPGVSPPAHPSATPTGTHPPAHPSATPTGTHPPAHPSATPAHHPSPTHAAHPTASPAPPHHSLARVYLPQVWRHPR